MQEHTINCATNAEWESGGYLGCTCGADEANKTERENGRVGAYVSLGDSQPMPEPNQQLFTIDEVKNLLDKQRAECASFVPQTIYTIDGGVYLYDAYANVRYANEPEIVKNKSEA